MRTPRFGVATRQDFVGGFEKDQDDVRNEFLNALAIEVRKDRREVMCADIDDDADPRRVLMRGDLLEERLDQMNGQVVAAVEAEVFERRLNVTFSRAGKARDDDEIFGTIHHLLHIVNRNDAIHEMRNEQAMVFRVVADVCRRIDVLHNRGERTAWLSAIDRLAVPARNKK